MVIATRLRDRDLLRLVKQRLDQPSPTNRQPSLRRAVLDVLAQPAPTYYVDFYNATAILGPALRGETEIRPGRYRCADQWVDMLRDLRELQKKHPKRNFRENILELCAGQAGHPRFYLTLRRAMAIVRPLLKAG